MALASDLGASAGSKHSDQLYRYCYQVASTAGLTTIHILGFDSADAVPLAEKCGIAFQLTNILRDIREDVETATASIQASRGPRPFPSHGSGYPSRNPHAGVLRAGSDYIVRYAPAHITRSHSH